MTLKLYIIDEVNAKLEGLPDDDLLELVDGMKLPIKGSYNTPSVQLGISDGKEPMFTVDGFFYLNEIETVVNTLGDLGYREDEIDITDMRDDLLHPVEDEKLPVVTPEYFSKYGVNLWEHQDEFFNRFLRTDKGIFDASTSAGKTIIMVGTAKLYEDYYPSLCVTLNEKLVKDAANMMEKFGMDYAVITPKVSVKKRAELVKKHRHIITTRKLAINLSELYDGFVGTFITDEVHILGDAYFEFGTNVMADCPIRLGLTGSLPDKRQDPLKLQKIFDMIGGGVVQEVLPSYLMEKGYAATLDVRVVKIKDENGLRKQEEAGKAWDWPMEENHYNNDADRIIAIADFIKDNCPRNTLVICRPELGIKLAAELDCDFVDGNTDTRVREEFYKRFDELDDYRLVASIGTSGVGLSIDLIHYGVVIDIGENPSVAGQSVGRFMRKDNDGDKKDSAIVWDIYSNMKFGSKQKRGRMKYFKERGFTVHDKYDTIVP